MSTIHLTLVVDVNALLNASCRCQQLIDASYRSQPSPVANWRQKETKETVESQIGHGEDKLET